MNVSGTPLTRASVDLRTPSKDPCPPPSAWHELMTEVSGDTMSARSAALLAHASSCTRCSPLLARAIENSPGIPDEEEAAWLESLPSSTPEGQRRLAETMQRVASGEPRPASRFSAQRPQQRMRWFNWPVLTASATAAAILGLSLWFFLRKPSDEQLLASAYDQHRLTELHLGQGHAVALESPTRGASTDVSSSQLLEIKLRTQQRLESHPNDATVRQTLGRIALVEHDGAAAIRHFEMAQALAPNLPGLDRDLAAAWFESAETTGQGTDYARSIDFFGKYLQRVNGKDAAALYNRGLAWQRQAVYTEAIKDFEAALALEKDPGWRAEIDRHLQSARSGSAEYLHPGPATAALTPASLLALKAESPGDYELYMFVAARLWLPRRAQDPESAAALQRLAKWGRGHHDDWLYDMLRTAPTAKEMDAESVLARALDASNSGEADAAMEAATTASSLFKKLGNKAGLARADAEIVYALHRRTHAAECLAHAAALDRSHALDAYSSIRLNDDLEVTSCLTMQQNMTRANAVLSRISLAAREDSLPIILLRSLGFASQNYNNVDESALSWKIGVEGLKEAQNIGPAVLRRYQLFYSLKTTAQKMGLDWVAAGLSDAAVAAASRSDNLQVLAYAFEQQGLDHAKIGQDAEAVASFAAADKILLKIPDGPAKTHYIADWTTDRAAFRVHHSQALPAVLNELQNAEPAFKTLDGYDTKLDFYMQYAELLLQANRSSDALAKAWYAVQQAEIAQATSLTPAAKQGAAEAASRAYLAVVRAYLQQNKPEEALRAWMWFQAAPWREAAHTNVPAQDLSAQLPPLPITDPGRITLIYALVDDHYVAWAIDHGRLVRTRTISRPAQQIEDRGAILLRLCADPKSSPQDLAVLGQGLYADLIGSFADLVAQATIVQFALDPTLTPLPFAALQHQGQYLGLERPLLFYAAGWSVNSPQQRRAITDQERLPSSAHVLVLRQTAGSGQAIIPGVYDESAQVARNFAGAEQRNASVWRSSTDLLLAGDPSLPNALPRADLLHYTGHGLAVASIAKGSSSSGAFALAPHTLPHCRLAVLAACESLHERETIGNDVPSFAGILLRAGASHVLATQWDVDSRSTRDIMVRFYAELTKNQTSPEALLRAQQSLYRHPDSAHPYFWSTFQIVAQ